MKYEIIYPKDPSQRTTGGSKLARFKAGIIAFLVVCIAIGLLIAAVILGSIIAVVILAVVTVALCVWGISRLLRRYVH